MQQIVLNAKGCSGRGVRFEPLSPTARDAIFEQAAKDVGAEGTVLELRKSEDSAALCAFVVEVTEKPGFKASKDLIDEKVVWKKVSAEQLEKNFGEYFNTKDRSALISIFRRLHDVSQKEVDDILGEALDVTSA